MDLSDPTRALAPTLDGPILAVLAVAGRPLTVGDVARQAARGSEIGIRRALARLVDQGIVLATEAGRNRIHELNREHVAAPAADILSSLRLELWHRLRAELATWLPVPAYAAVFGSAARGDGNESSDIDLLLVHRTPEPEQWHEQVDRLRELVRRWTGNPLQVVAISYEQWSGRAGELQALLAEVRRDGIQVAGSPTGTAA